MGDCFSFIFFLLFLVSPIEPSLCAQEPHRLHSSGAMRKLLRLLVSPLPLISWPQGSVTKQISEYQYATVVEGKLGANDTLFVSGQCMNHLSKKDCDLFFATSKSQILRCLPVQKETCGGRYYLLELKNIKANLWAELCQDPLIESIWMMVGVCSPSIGDERGIFTCSIPTDIQV